MAAQGNNKIQIKRSTANPTIPSLSAGELAFSQASNTLFIGAPDGTSGNIPIGGQRVPGTLTANQALVANSTSGIDKIIVANAAITKLYTAQNGYGSSGYVLAVDGSGNVYWTSAGSLTVTPAGSNKYVQFNDSGALGATSGFQFDKTTNTVSVSNAVSVGNSSTNTVIGYNSTDSSVAEFGANQNNFIEVAIYNSNTGVTASADLVINDNGGPGTTNFNFVDLGINGSGYSNTSWTINGPSDGYLYTGNTNFSIGTANTNYLSFFTGGTLAANERVRLLAGGNVGINSTTADATLKVQGTANVTGAVTIGGQTTFGANLILGSSAISANGGYGSAGQVLYSNGTVNYWATPAAGVTGSDTQVQYNASGSAGASAGMTFAYTTNTFTVSNTIVAGLALNINAYGTAANGIAANSSTIKIGNSSVNASINSTAFSGSANNAAYLGGVAASSYATQSYVTSQGYLTSSSLSGYATQSYADTAAGTAYSNAMADTLSRNGSYTGNNTFGGTNTVINSNTFINATLAVSSYGTTTGGVVANTTGIFFGNTVSNGYINATALFFGNATVNTTHNTTLVQVANSTSTANLTAAGLTIGTAVVNTTVHQIGANVYANASAFFVGNSTVNSIMTAGSLALNGSTLTVGNSTGTTTSVTFGNNSVNTTFDGASVKISNATVTVFQANTTNTLVYSLQTVVNTASIGSAVSVIASGNVGIGNSSPTDKLSVNGTGYFGGNVTITGANIVATSSQLNVRDIVATGNLTVSGTVTTLNTQTLTVNDNIIELGLNNTTTDTVDTGFFSPAGNATAVWYSGIARVASFSANNNAVFRVFVSNTNPNTASVIENTSNTTTSTLVAYLAPYATSSSLGGAFSVNSTAIAITANSTVSANFTANSLSLSTALAASYGGTGQSSYTVGDLLYASGTTALSKLSTGGSSANGYVLQVDSAGLPIWAGLDGGTF